ncbi:MAG: site-specific DNA-methyltransferase, partial [Clostridiales bacterium]|nr:site-specific DNA-methyltransferase [Clostridiales bacterium]
MGVITDIHEGYLEGLNIAGRMLDNKDEIFESSENHFFELKETQDNVNRLALGDNVEYMKWLINNGYKDKLRLIYIDPPFFTKTKYNASVVLNDNSGKKYKIHHLAYDDTFESNLKLYIENITCRLVLMKELLASDGTIWVHLDWHSLHYVKIIMDEIFGEKNFINEIIWKYKSGGSSHKHFSKKHDVILVYSKSNKYYLNVPKEKSYNRNLKPYRFKGVKEFKDEYGWYTMVNMKDVWSIDMVGRTSKERNGYATQKPLELLE